MEHTLDQTLLSQDCQRTEKLSAPVSEEFLKYCSVVCPMNTFDLVIEKYKLLSSSHMKNQTLLIRNYVINVLIKFYCSVDLAQDTSTCSSWLNIFIKYLLLAEAEDTEMTLRIEFFSIETKESREEKRKSV